MSQSPADRPRIAGRSHRDSARSPVDRNGPPGLASASTSATTNDPLAARVDGRTAQGRRTRDLYWSLYAALGRPEDLATKALILAAAELVTLAEVARADLLGGRGDVNQVVRLENLSTRALRRIGVDGPAAKPVGPTLAEYLAQRYGDAPASPDTEDDEDLDAEEQAISEATPCES